MNKFNYSNLKNLAGDLVAKFGDDIILRTFTSSGPNYNPTLTPIDVPIKAIKLSWRVDFVSGTLENQGDIQFLTAHTSLIISGDSIVYDGKEYTVINPEIIKPGDALILQKVPARS